jgi:hypothetical protein
VLHPNADPITDPDQGPTKITVHTFNRKEKEEKILTAIVQAWLDCILEKTRAHK